MRAAKSSTSNLLLTERAWPIRPPAVSRKKDKYPCHLPGSVPRPPYPSANSPPDQLSITQYQYLIHRDPGEYFMYPVRCMEWLPRVQDTAWYGPKWTSLISVSCSQCALSGSVRIHLSTRLNHSGIEFSYLNQTNSPPFPIPLSLHFPSSSPHLNIHLLS